MAYVNKEWVTGETITADALNNLERGVQDALSGDSRFMLINATTMDMQTVTSIDKTSEEIIDFILDGGIPIVRLVNNNPYAPYEAAYYMFQTYEQLGWTGDERSVQFVTLRVRINLSGMTVDEAELIVTDNGASISQVSKTIS